MINERIRELVEQAEQELANIPKGMFSMPIIITKQKFNERLAELIIKECIICAEREWIRNGDTEHNRAVNKVIESIKEHFGVE